MARPTNESRKKGNYLKEQFQAMEIALNQLEEICKTSNVTQKEEMAGSIGILVGKLMVRYSNVVNELGVYEDE